MVEVNQAVFDLSHFDMHLVNIGGYGDVASNRQPVGVGEAACRHCLDQTLVAEDEKRYGALFFAVSNAHLISKWLDNGMDVTPDRLAQLYSKWTRRYWFDVSPNKMGWM
jgi:hypothetical protein